MKSVYGNSFVLNPVQLLRYFYCSGFSVRGKVKNHHKKNGSYCVVQVQYTAYGEVYLDSNPEFQLVIGFHGGLYDPLTKLVHFTQRDYDVLAGRWTSPDYSMWSKIGKDPSPFNLYMFKNNNPLSDMLDIKNYVTGKRSICLNVVHMLHSVV